MDERLQFILDAQSDRFTMTELCSRPSRTSFRHFDNMKGWIARAAATVFT